MGSFCVFWLYFTTLALLSEDKLGTLPIVHSIQGLRISTFWVYSARDQKTGTKLGNFNKDYVNLTRRYYCNSINVCQLLTTSISPWDTSKQ